MRGRGVCGRWGRGWGGGRREESGRFGEPPERRAVGAPAEARACSGFRACPLGQTARPVQHRARWWAGEGVACGAAEAAAARRVRSPGAPAQTRRKGDAPASSLGAPGRARNHRLRSPVSARSAPVWKRGMPGRRAWVLAGWSGHRRRRPPSLSSLFSLALRAPAPRGPSPFHIARAGEYAERGRQQEGARLSPKGLTHHGC